MRRRPGEQWGHSIRMLDATSTGLCGIDGCEEPAVYEASWYFQSQGGRPWRASRLLCPAGAEEFADRHVLTASWFRSSRPDPRQPSPSWPLPSWPSPCLQHGWIVGGLPLHRALELASRCGMCRVPGRGLQGGNPTKDQRLWISQLERAGVDVGVWRPADLLAGRILAELAGESS